MKNLTKQYSALTASERFQLFFAALDRGDDLELDRLENTCPERTYRAQDQAYARPKARFTTLALMAALGRAQDDLLAMLALVIVLCEEGEDSEPGASDKAKSAFQSMMERRAGKLAGWRRFCDEIGTNADAVTKRLVGGSEWAMGVVEGVYAEVAAQQSIGEAVDRDFGRVNAVANCELETLMQIWRERAVS